MAGRALPAIFAALALLAALAPARAMAAEPRGSAKAAAKSASELSIDQIEIIGATIFPRQDIEEAVEVEPGDRLERVKVVKSAENLQALYRLHGYDEMTIESRLVRKRGEDRTIENVLEFHVAEGRPTRVAGFGFVPESIRDEAFQKYWARLEGTLAAKVGLLPGDIFDQERIANAKRGLQDVLASEEFVGARVDDVRAVTAAAPAGQAAGTTARWVTVEFHVDLGDRVTFGFRGNAAFSANQLSALVEEQRVLGFGKDYVGAIRGRIEEEYRTLGFARVKVESYTFEKPTSQERHVTYVLDEGPRITTDSIDFDGNTVFSTAELRRRFLERASPAVQHGYFVEKDIQKAAELVVDWMKSQGYLGAKLVTVTSGQPSRLRDLPVPEHALRVVVYVYEGDQTLAQSVSFKGSTVFSEEELRARLGVREGAPLNLFAFSAGIEALKAAYRDKGYLAAAITNEGTNEVVKYSQENRYADILLLIQEGPQFRVSKVYIEGLVLTREKVVRRELLFKEGEVLREGDLILTEARLRRIGIFSSVSVRAADDPDSPVHKIVRINLQEGTPGILAGGFGFRNDLGGRVFGQVAYSNVGGRNHTLSLFGSVNRRIEDYRMLEGQVQLAYVWPWFLMDELTFRPTFTVSSAQFLTFDANDITAAATWERKLLRKPNLTGGLTYSMEKIRQFNSQNAASALVDDQEIRIGAITPSLRLDMRDSPLAPTAGLFATSSFELASPLLGSQTDPFPVGYTRWQFRTDYYLPAGRDITWYFSFRTGIERSTEPPNGNIQSGAIPLIKQFALGGPDSLRGFKDQELNHQDVKITGTMSYVNYRTQLDFPFAGALRFGPFLDAANLLFDNYSFGALRFGTGVGFHYQTPVGPLNLDWAFKIAPQKDEDPFLFHFSIGVI